MKVDNIEELPKEMLLRILIFSITRCEDIAILSCINKHFNYLMQDHTIWNELNMKFFGLSLSLRQSTVKSEQAQNSWNFFNLVPTKSKITKSLTQKNFFKEQWLKRNLVTNTVKTKDWLSDDSSSHIIMELLSLKKVTDSSQISKYLKNHSGDFHKFSDLEYLKLIRLMVVNQATTLWEAILQDKDISRRIYGNSQMHPKDIWDMSLYGNVINILVEHDYFLEKFFEYNGKVKVQMQKNPGWPVLGALHYYSIETNVFSVTTLETIFDLIQDDFRFNYSFNYSKKLRWNKVPKIVRNLIQNKENNDRINFIKYLLGYPQNNITIEISLADKLIANDIFSVDQAPDVLKLLDNSPNLQSVLLKNTFIIKYGSVISNQENQLEQKILNTNAKVNLGNHQQDVDQNFVIELQKTVLNQQNQIENLTNQLQLLTDQYKSLAMVVSDQQKTINLLSHQLNLEAAVNPETHYRR